MATLNLTTEQQQLVEFFESKDFSVYAFEQDGILIADIETWTENGVNMIVNLNPFTKEAFTEAINNFSIDEEIDLHRQDKKYCEQFTITRSLKDFTIFYNMLKKLDKELQKTSKPKKQKKNVEDKILDALFAEYNKSYEETKEGQVFPQWLNDEQLTWVLTVIKNNKF